MHRDKQMIPTLHTFEGPPNRNTSTENLLVRKAKICTGGNELPPTTATNGASLLLPLTADAKPVNRITKDEDIHEFITHCAKEHHA
jgi:hypothetical protein